MAYNDRGQTLIDANQLNLGEGFVADNLTGQLKLDLLKIEDLLGLGEVAKINVVPIENGGTGASTANNARRDLGFGTAAAYDVGNSEGSVPVITANSTLELGGFKAGDMLLDDGGLKQGGAYIITSRGAEVQPVAEMSANPDLAEVVTKLAEVITKFNSLVNELKSHHGLIA